LVLRQKGKVGVRGGDGGKIAVETESIEKHVNGTHSGRKIGCKRRALEKRRKGGPRKSRKRG